jgi:uroporphyrin-3 C-methyltransferase
MTDPIITEVETPSSLERKPRSSFGIIVLIIILLILLAAMGFAGFQSMKEKMAFSKKLAALQKEVTSNQKNLTSLQQTLEELRIANQKTEALSTQQEQMLTEWRAAQKGDLTKWRMAEAQYLVRLANDSVQFESNSVLGLILLKRAQQILQSLQDTALLDIQKSLALDIANLEAAQQVNTTILYLDLTGVKSQIDQLVLPTSPLNNKELTPPATPTETHRSWWEKGLDHSWQALSKIVIVRYNGSNALPLVLPEEKLFLYQNLHAQIESALWAVLHKNPEIYQASLDRAISWTKKYFVQDAATTAVLQKLDALRAINIKPPAINFSATLQLFDTYFSHTGPVSTGQ